MKIIAKDEAEFTIFRFGANEIRVVDKSGAPWFVAADVCRALDLGNPTKAIKNLDDDEVALTSIQGLSRGNNQANIVSESGMYTLVLRCRDAVNKGSVPHTFRKWVTAEVLPSVRKNGFYQKPVTDKKTRLSSATQLTPLRQTAERLITTGIGKIYPDIWKLVHQKFEIEHIHQLRPDQVFEAVEFLNAIEGEYLGKANKQMSLPISYSMEYFNQYRWMNGINEQSLSAPWRYPANMLTPNGDNPNPLGHMLGEMRQMGYEVDAALFQLQSLQHHLEMIRHKIDRAQMSLR
ncbi:UNVERIFIED_ORG: prophage antirepressor-like protein [Buttiauxella agrestis ATCC 33320]